MEKPINMNAELEQMKRELAQKWEIDLHRQKILLSDLTALLDKQREVILADMYPKEFMEWIGSEELYCDKGEWLCPVADSVYGEIIRKTSDELFDYWLENVKK